MTRHLFLVEFGFIDVVILGRGAEGNGKERVVVHEGQRNKEPRRLLLCFSQTVQLDTIVSSIVVLEQKTIFLEE